MLSQVSGGISLQGVVLAGLVLGALGVLADITEPVVASLVGAIALLISVPLTTGLAAAVVARIPAEALPSSGHHHH